MAIAQTHAFPARLEWTGASQGPTQDVRSYSREYEIHFPGKPAIAGSAAPAYLGDPGRANPEELFAASLAGCQMLTYLALAARAQILVTAYTDDAEATLGPVDGKWQIVKVTLRPKITVAAGSDAAKARELIAAAHEGCFVARAVSCEVTTEPEIVEA